MPLTEDVGRTLLGKSDWLPMTKDFDELLELLSPDFELLMTYLASDHPWLSESQNLTNRARFLALAHNIALVILDCQNEAVSVECPPWLPPLVGAWHERRATVSTFNYDTLVEKVFRELHPRWSHLLLYRVPITPMLSRTAAVLAGPDEETFWYLKLHGSVSWYYSGAGQFYGEQIYDIAPTAGWQPDGIADLLTTNPDKTRLIVPPTTQKSTFFANETVRAQWATTNFMLTKRATTLYFIGYSLPPTDQMVRFMLLSVSDQAQVVVVNKESWDTIGPAYKSAMPAVFDWNIFYTGRETVVEEFARAYSDGSIENKAALRS